MSRNAIKRDVDQQILSEWIADGARVLDLGCGRGILLADLISSKHCYGVGIDNNVSKIASCVKRGVPAYQGDLMDLLPLYDDQSFDWVVCSRTLQELNNPLEILREALRVGKRLAIGFVNHGYWINRWQMLRDGSRITNEVYPEPWWQSRAMNPVSVSSFEAFCRAEGASIESRVFLASDWRTPCNFMPSLFAGYAVYELRRGAA